MKTTSTLTFLALAVCASASQALEQSVHGTHHVRVHTSDVTGESEHQRSFVAAEVVGANEDDSSDDREADVNVSEDSESSDESVDASAPSHARAAYSSHAKAITTHTCRPAQNEPWANQILHACVEKINGYTNFYYKTKDGVRRYNCFCNDDNWRGLKDLFYPWMHGYILQSPVSKNFWCHTKSNDAYLVHGYKNKFDYVLDSTNAYLCRRE